MKQRNIAENKVILDQIKADFGHDKLVEASKRDAQACDNGKEGKGKGKAKEKEKDVTTFIQKRVSPRIADSKKCVYIHMTTNKLDVNGGLISPPRFPVGLQWILPDSTGFHWTPPDSMFGGSPYKVSGLDWIFSPVESGRIHRIFSPVGLYQTESPVQSSGFHWTGSS